MWKEHNSLGDGPPKRRTPWFVIGLFGILIFLIFVLLTVPTVARRVHEPYVPVAHEPSTTELAQQVCTNHNEQFVSWKASGIGVKVVFCRSSGIELTQRFIRAD